MAGADFPNYLSFSTLPVVSPTSIPSSMTSPVPWIKQMKVELMDSVVTSDIPSLRSAFFWSGDVVAKDLVSRLCPNKKAVTALLKHSQWSKKPSSKVPSRKCFVSYLKAVLDAVSASVPRSSFHKGVVLLVNAVPDHRDFDDNDSPSISLPFQINSLLGPTRYCHVFLSKYWEDLEDTEDACIWDEHTLQAATCARISFASERDRWFVVAVMIDQAKTSVALAIFHRGGLIQTPYLSLAKVKDTQEFVRIMLGLASWSDATQAGVDVTRAVTSSPDGKVVERVSLPVLGECQVFGDAIYEYNCVRGRATVLQLVQRVGAPLLPHPSPAAPTRSSRPRTSPETLPEGSPSEKTPKDRYFLRSGKEGVESGSTIRDSIAMPIGRKRKAAAGSQDSRPSKMTKTFRSTTPKISSPSPETSTLTDAESRELEQHRDEVFLLKDSYPLADRSRGSDVFKALDGKFGIPNIVASYDVLNGAHNILARLGISADGLLNGQKVEQRCHRRTVIRNGGLSLAHAASPLELVRALLHAVLGYENILENGWLHRDIHFGNILLLPQPESRQAMTEMPPSICTETKGLCTAVLLGSDNAVRWPITGTYPASDWHDILPFASHRFVLHLHAPHIPYTHTVHDDLESFIWVLLWTVFRILHEKNRLTKGDLSIWLSFSAVGIKPEEMSLCQGAVKFLFTGGLHFSTPTSPWIPFVTKLFHALSGEGVLKGGEGMTAEEIERKSVRDFAEVLLDALNSSSLPMSWDYAYPEGQWARG